MGNRNAIQVREPLNSLSPLSSRCLKCSLVVSCLTFLVLSSACGKEERSTGASAEAVQLSTGAWAQGVPPAPIGDNWSSAIARLGDAARQAQLSVDLQRANVKSLAADSYIVSVPTVAQIRKLPDLSLGQITNLLLVKAPQSSGRIAFSGQVIGDGIFMVKAFVETCNVTEKSLKVQLLNLNQQVAREIPVSVSIAPAGAVETDSMVIIVARVTPLYMPGVPTATCHGRCIADACKMVGHEVNGKGICDTSHFTQTQRVAFLNAYWKCSDFWCNWGSQLWEFGGLVVAIAHLGHFLKGL
jgi:hypothetical protein